MCWQYIYLIFHYFLIILQTKCETTGFCWWQGLYQWLCVYRALQKGPIIEVVSLFYFIYFVVSFE